MKHGDLVKKIVTKEFRDLCLNKYPALKDNLSYRKFFQYLCFGVNYSDFKGFFSDAKLVIDSYYIAECCGEKTNFEAKNFVTGDFLKEFQKNILPKFTWNEHIPYVEGSWIGIPRTVKSFGFNADMEELIQKEVESLETENLVYFASGRSYNKLNRKEGIEQADKIYNEEKQSFKLNETQTTILNYLEKVPPIAFSRKLESNKQLILNEIEKVDNLEKKYIQFRILQSIKENPAVYYKPSKNLRTCRLFHSSDCAVGLKKEVRQAFCHGWTEIDLKSSQFAIIAEILQAPLSLAFLKSGGELWKWLHESFFGINIEMSANHKRAYKALIYGISFGRGKKDIKKELKTLNINHEIIFSNPIVKELFDKRDQWFDKINENGYVTDVWNNKLEVSKDRWAGAVAAAKIQSIEMEIIAPIFKIAEQHKDDCQIMIFQHDGMCISFPDRAKKERIIKRMQQAVKDAAAKFNVMTALDVKDL